MEIKTFTNSFFNSNSYVVAIEDDVWIIDPGDAEPLINEVNKYGRGLKGILLTHSHFDHIYGLNEIVARYTEVPIYTNELGAKMLVSAKLNMSKYCERPFELQYPENVILTNDHTDIGPFRVYATPGHNPSCLTFVVRNAIFTGDAYIPGIAVVTNLPKSDKLQSDQSVKLILDLAKDKIIYPGHFINNN
jgi:glyoxylase-like metal-dependent hydrolase (beta-lactamase superfamily II)